MHRKPLWKQLWQWVQTIFTIRDIVSGVIWIVSLIISGGAGSYIAVSQSLTRGIPSAIILLLILLPLGQLTWKSTKLKRQQRIDLYKAICEKIRIERGMAEEASTKGWRAYLPYFKSHPNFIEAKNKQGEENAVVEMLLVNRQSPVLDNMLLNSKEYKQINNDIDKLRQNMNQSNYDKLVSLFMELVKINNHSIAISLLVGKHQEPIDSYRMIKNLIAEGDKRIEEIHRKTRMFAYTYNPFLRS